MNECLYTEEEAERLKRKSHGKIVGLEKKTYMASVQICAGENANKSGVSENIANYFMMVLFMESHNLLLRCRGDSTSRSAEVQHPQGRNHVSFP